MQAILDDLRLSLKTFVGNPLRSLLTLLGIVIGVATVIAMMALIERSPIETIWSERAALVNRASAASIRHKR